MLFIISSSSWSHYNALLLSRSTQVSYFQLESRDTVLSGTFPRYFFSLNILFYARHYNAAISFDESVPFSTPLSHVLTHSLLFPCSSLCHREVVFPKVLLIWLLAGCVQWEAWLEHWRARWRRAQVSINYCYVIAKVCHTTASTPFRLPHQCTYWDISALSCRSWGNYAPCFDLSGGSQLPISLILRGLVGYQGIFFPLQLQKSKWASLLCRHALSLCLCHVC